MSKDTITVSMNVYDIPILVEALEKADKEIERLNNIIEEIIKICEENEYLTLIKDIKRLKDSDKE